MANALITGVSGLRSHQKMIDVVGHNLANLNTTGFKARRAQFSDVFYETVKGGAGGARGAIGGSNPAQIGNGSKLSTIGSDFSQGNIESTGSTFDFAIDGDGFFVVDSGQGPLYTRAGVFHVDQQGYLVDSATGYRIQRFGSIGTFNGSTPSFQNVGDSDIRVPLGASIPGQPTSKVTLTGNLDPAAPVGQSVFGGMEIFDARGEAQLVGLSFEKASDGTWTMRANVPPELGTAESGSIEGITFSPDGSFSSVSGSSGEIAIQFIGDPDPQTIAIDFGSPGTLNGLTSIAGESTFGTSQDGYSSGSLVSISVEGDGLTEGIGSNGRRFDVAQMAMASFTNPHGLTGEGNNFYSQSVASGDADVGTAGTGRRGRIASGQLESSNVDIATEFTRLIVAQRGFSANARTITVTDEVLEELNSLIR